MVLKRCDRPYLAGKWAWTPCGRLQDGLTVSLWCTLWWFPFTCARLCGAFALHLFQAAFLCSYAGDLVCRRVTRKLDVRAADPLAPVGTPCYHFHSRTPFYNNNFFTWWDECFAATNPRSSSFKKLLPCFNVLSSRDLQKLLALGVWNVSIKLYYNVLIGFNS